MNRLNLILYVGMVVVVLSLAGVIAYQQLEISKLYGQNRELAVSNLQKDEENADLRNSYNQLNITYSQTLNSLGQLTDMLEVKDSELSQLQQDYSNLTISYNGLLTQYNGLRDSIMELSLDFGGREGVLVLNYSWVKSMRGLDRLHAVTMEIFNLLEPCEIDVKIYSETWGTSKTFTYSMPNGYKKFVEAWNEGWTDSEYPEIIIQNVRRD